MPVNRKKILAEACLLVAFSCLCGLTINYKLVLDAFTGQLEPQALLVEETGGAEQLPFPAILDEVQQLVKAGGVLVDARSAEVYALGHIAGAISLPMEELESRLDAFKQEVALNRVVVTYCSGFGCPDSFDLGILLLQEGFVDVRVFEGGFPEWRDAGLPVAGGQP